MRCKAEQAELQRDPPRLRERHGSAPIALSREVELDVFRQPVEKETRHDERYGRDPQDGGSQKPQPGDRVDHGGAPRRVRPPGGDPQALAHQRQRDLVSEEFVEGEPQARRSFRLDSVGVAGAMDRHQRLAEGGQSSSARRARTWRQRFPERRVDGEPFPPVRQRGEPRQRPVDGLAEHARVEPLGQPIDRLGQRHGREAGLVEDAIGMHHLAMPVVEFQLARYPTLGTKRQHLLDPGMVGQEEHQQHVAGRVLDQHLVWRT